MLSGLCALQWGKLARPPKGRVLGRTLSNGPAIGALFEVHPQAVGWYGDGSGRWRVRRQEGTGGRRDNGVFNGG